MAAGCAIVAHPIACEGINVHDDHDVVLASTPVEFARAIDALLLDGAKARQLGAAARQLAVSEYSFAAIGASFVTQLQDIIANHVAPES